MDYTLELSSLFYHFLFYVTDLYTQSWVGYVNYAIILAGVVFASITYRDKYLNGSISYGKSVSVGFLSGLFSGVLVAIYTVVFMTVMGEEYIQTLMDIAEEKMLSSQPNMTDDEIDMAMNMTKKMMTPGWVSVMVFLGSGFFALVFALIASIFIKKEESTTTETEQ
ncbi:MAG: DUF4199 domain-containing protein [Bacteroidales bacterium]